MRLHASSRSLWPFGQPLFLALSQSKAARPPAEKPGTRRIGKSQINRDRSEDRLKIGTGELADLFLDTRQANRLDVMNSALKDGACRCPNMDLRGPTFGSMTAAQRGDIPRRCGVAGPSMATTDALEGIPGRAVALVDATAPQFRTRPRCVAWIDRDQRDAGKCRFVGQIGPKLGERPTVVRSALRPLNRCPIADAFKVFDGNPAPGVCGLPNDSLADPVVKVGCVSRFQA